MSAIACDFCGKGQREVEKLIKGPTSLICNECLILSMSILLEGQSLASLLTQVAGTASRQTPLTQVAPLFDAALAVVGTHVEDAKAIARTAFRLHDPDAVLRAHDVIPDAQRDAELVVRDALSLDARGDSPAAIDVLDHLDASVPLAPTWALARRVAWGLALLEARAPRERTALDELDAIGRALEVQLSTLTYPDDADLDALRTHLAIFRARIALARGDAELAERSLSDVPFAEDDPRAWAARHDAAVLRGLRASTDPARDRALALLDEHAPLALRLRGTRV